MKVQIWDTAGQEQYDKLRPLSYPDTDIFMICYQTNNYTSLQSVFQKWIPEITSCKPYTPFVLVGTKTDLPLFVSPQKATAIDQQLIDSNASICLECSAKTNDNVENVFEQALRVGLNHKLSPKFKRVQMKHCCLVM